MMRHDAVSIYRYVDPIRYLNDALQWRKEHEPRFSLRAWAKALGLKSSTPIAQVLKGQRPVPARYVPKFASLLKLSGSERKYFEALVGISRARGTEEQELWIKRAQKIYDEVSFEFDFIEEFRFMQNPLLASLLSLIERPEFRLDLKWIQRRLPVEADAKRIQEAFDFLLARGFIALDSGGKLSRTRNHPWLRKEMSALSHKRLADVALAHAARAVYQNGIDEREFGRQRRRDVPRAKKAIRDFTASLIRQLAAEGGSGLYPAELCRATA